MMMVVMMMIEFFFCFDFRTFEIMMNTFDSATDHTTPRLLRRRTDLRLKYLEQSS